MAELPTRPHGTLRNTPQTSAGSLKASSAVDGMEMAAAGDASSQSTVQGMSMNMLSTSGTAVHVWPQCSSDCSTDISHLGSEPLVWPVTARSAARQFSHCQRSDKVTGVHQTSPSGSRTAAKLANIGSFLPSRNAQQHLGGSCQHLPSQPSPVPVALCSTQSCALQKGACVWQGWNLSACNARRFSRKITSSCCPKI